MGHGGVIDGGRHGLRRSSTRSSANFDERGEVGAAVTVYVHGRRVVVDLWGGSRTRAAVGPGRRRRRPSSSPAPRASSRSAPTSSSRRAGWTSMLRWRATGRSSLSTARRYHRAVAADPPGRPARPRPSSDPGRGPGLGPGHRGHRGPGPALAARAPRMRTTRSLRLARRRGHPAHQPASPSARSYGDGSREPLGLRLWIGLPAEERDDVAWLVAPLPDTRPGGCPGHRRRTRATRSSPAASRWEARSPSPRMATT